MLTRQFPNEGWREALEQMTLWLRAGTPFCHPRFVDGELNAIIGAKGANCDKHRYFRGLGEALHKALMEIAARHPHHGNLLVGGGGWKDPKRNAYVHKHHLVSRVPWVPAQVFVAGVLTMTTMRFLNALVATGKSTVVVCNKAVAPVCKRLKARLVLVPARNCWLKRRRVQRDLRSATSPGSIVLYAAGMPAAVWMWDMWKRSPDSTHIDIGHLFDRAFGMDSRQWFHKNTERRRVYDKHYAPWFRNEGT